MDMNAVIAALRDRAKKFVSLETPADVDAIDTATDIAAGFTPGLGTALAARDFERARRDDDLLGMGLSAAGMVPLIGGAARAANKARKTEATIDALRRPAKRNDMSADYLQDLISSQRYIDRDTVARKIKGKDFKVMVTPSFEVDGKNVRAIVDGHHALEAAIRSGNIPSFVTSTPRTNDRIDLILQNKVDDYLESAYHDSPWYWFSTKRDIW